MKKFPLVLLVCASSALAQAPSSQPTATPTAQPAAAEQGAPVKKETVRRARPVKKAVQATPTPEATPAPVRHSWFYRVFHVFGGSPKAAPTATPAPTPVQKAPAKRAAKATPTPAESPAPEATPKATPAPKATATPAATAEAKPTATPKPSPTPKATPTPKPSPTPKATPTPKPSPTPKATATPAPKAAGTPAAARDEGLGAYRKTKEAALQDATVAALLHTMQATPEGTPGYKAAAKAYTEALFSQMRKLDPAQKESFDRMQGAYQRRIDAGKPILE